MRWSKWYWKESPVRCNLWRINEMEKTETGTFPKWIFAVIAIGGLLASGIYIGIMSIEGISGVHLAQAAGFGIVGLLMFWGVYSREWLDRYSGWKKMSFDKRINWFLTLPCWTIPRPAHNPEMSSWKEYFDIFWFQYKTDRCYRQGIRLRSEHHWIEWRNSFWEFYPLTFPVPARIPCWWSGSAHTSTGKTVLSAIRRVSTGN